MTKRELREKIKKKREELSLDEVNEKSEVIISKFLESKYYKNSQVIMSYMPIKNEVDVIKLNKRILTDNKKLILPVINSKNQIIACEVNLLSELRKKGKYSIMEPDLDKEFEEAIDTVIIPGVVFDKQGNRIGFGKGFYDKFLKEIDALRVSLLYKFQLLEKIPSESHDEKVEIIFTEGENIYAK